MVCSKVTSNDPLRKLWIGIICSSPRKESRETCHQNPSIGQTLLSGLVSLKQIVVVLSFPGDVVLIQYVSENGRFTPKWQFLSGTWESTIKVGGIIFSGKIQQNNKYAMYSNTTEVPKNDPCPWFLVVLSPTSAQFYIAFAFALSCVYQYFRGLLVLYGIVYLELKPFIAGL